MKNGIVEIVHPRNGKTEDKLVFIGSVLVIFTAFLLLNLFYSHNRHATAFVPKGLRQHLISLSNAAEEISMITELDGALPSLDTIMGLGISPFVKNTALNTPNLIWRQYNRCFLTRVSEQDKAYQLRLLMLESQDERFQLSWRLARKIEPLTAEACSAEHDWYIIDKYNRLNQEQHEH